MFELIAQGTDPDHRWRRQLPADQEITLGRTTPAFRVPWDDRISREHVRLQWRDEALRVEKIASAANPVFYHGETAEEFLLQPGEHFVIGKTTFTLIKEHVQATLALPNPISQRTFSPEFLQQVHFRNAEQRIDVLNRLPDVISSAGNQLDLLNRLSNTLLSGIPAAATVGFIRMQDAANDRTSTSDNRAEIKILHWDQRGTITGDFQPSEKLIRQAIDSQESILHLWQLQSLSPGESSAFTFDLENDWAFVCPLDSEATPRWGIYVTGSQFSGSVDTAPGADAEDLQGDIKFCELVGSILKNLLQVQQLEARQASLRSFFSPVVLSALAGRDPDEVLKPKQVATSVLFCDLRGFAKTSEEMSDELFRLLQRVSQSLDVVTSKILMHSGVIGDFHGDSVMGFWGWPLEQADSAMRAVQTALDIKAAFHARDDSHSGEQMDLPIGIGIASGIAVAGKIGTRDQVKVTAFGPVVNLASRLEGMNRFLNLAILIDRATRDEVVSHRSARKFRLRNLGLFQPFGLNAATEVFQVIDERDGLTDDEIVCFESALNAFQSPDWSAVAKLLQPIASEDPGKQFLLSFMQQSNDRPPTGWCGVIELKNK